jgi:hypothetical protein
MRVGLAGRTVRQYWQAALRLQPAVFRVSLDGAQQECLDRLGDISVGDAGCTYAIDIDIDIYNYISSPSSYYNAAGKIYIHNRRKFGRQETSGIRRLCRPLSLQWFGTGRRLGTLR